MKVFDYIFDLIFPKLCIGCKNHLFENEHYLCLYCIEQLNFVPITLQNHPLLCQQFYGRFIFNNVNALLFFDNNSTTKQLLHHLKYKNQPEIGKLLAQLTFTRYNEHKQFKNKQGIIKVPIHKKRLKERGYNQLDSFAASISNAFQIPILEDIIVRKSYTKSQTSKNRQGRTYLQTHFEIKNIEKIKNMHLLIIDDVITTGSTISQIANLLLQGEKTQVSVFAIAVTK